MGPFIRGEASPFDRCDLFGMTPLYVSHLYLHRSLICLVAECKKYAAASLKLSVCSILLGQSADGNAVYFRQKKIFRKLKFT